MVEGVGLGEWGVAEGGEEGEGGELGLVLLGAVEGHGDGESLRHKGTGSLPVRRCSRKPRI